MTEQTRTIGRMDLRRQRNRFKLIVFLEAYLKVRGRFGSWKRAQLEEKILELAEKDPEGTWAQWKISILGKGEGDHVEIKKVDVPEEVIKEAVDKALDGYSDQLKNNLAEHVANAIEKHLRFDDQLNTVKEWQANAERMRTKASEQFHQTQVLFEQHQESIDAINTAVANADKYVKQSIAREMTKYRKVEIKNVTTGKSVKQGDEVYLEEFDTLLQLLTARKHVLMVGPAGCGKSHVAGQLYDALCATGSFPKSSQRMAELSCSEGMSESHAQGWLIPVGNGGKFVYVSVGFVECYEKGGLFFLDEIDASDPNMLAWFNKALANKSFTIPQRHESPEVIRHKDFVCVAAANTFGTGGNAVYTGRNALDAATLDRFRCGTIVINYSDTIERKLVDPEVYEWAKRIRSKIEEWQLQRIMSTRVMIDYTDMKNLYGWGQEEWERTYFAGWTDDELRRVM